MYDNPSISALLRWDAGTKIPEESYARLRADPRYPVAVRTFAANMLAEGDTDPLLDGILKDAGRNVAALCTAHLHFSGGLTLPRLKGLCDSFGLLSVGRARALLYYLRYLGYVEPAQPRDAQRPVLYRPTVRFIETWRAHQRAVLRAVLVLEPAIAILLERFESPGVFETWSRLLCECFLESAPELDRDSPYFQVFMHGNAGIQIVHFLLAASTDDCFPPAGPIALSVSALARRFKVSRVHLRRLLAAAERKQLLCVLGPGAIALQPAGRQAIDMVFATQMIRFLMTAARTFKQHPELACACGSADD